MTTNNSVNSVLSGTTGTGNFVGSTSPTLVTPAIGAPSSGTLTNCIGLPSGSGITCTATNNNASSGQLGEFISSQVLQANATSISSQTSTNLTSISLTAGDWNVTGGITFIPNVSGTSAFSGAGISTTSNTLPDGSLVNYIGTNSTGQAVSGIPVPQRLSLSTTTTVYIVGNINITAGTFSQCGYISARRVR